MEDSKLLCYGNDLCCFLLQVCGGDLPYVGVDFLQSQHTRCHEASLRRFHSVRKMGGEQFSQPYIDELECAISDHYASLMRQNEAKNVFSAARTPAVVSAFAAMFYVLSGVFGTVGLLSLANICYIVMLSFVVALSVWVYTRYTGEHREFGQIVDHIADVLWDEVSTIHLSLCFVFRCVFFISKMIVFFRHLCPKNQWLMFFCV